MVLVQVSVIAYPRSECESAQSPPSKAANLELGGICHCSVTDPPSESGVGGCHCMASLECLLDIIRALRMGSCLSAESRSPLPGSPMSPTLGIRKKKSSRKRPGSRGSSFEYRREDPIHRIPGRHFLNGSSEFASLFCQQGRKGINQDAMIVWENFCSRKDMVFCAVFDGHGPFGHAVAKRVRDLLPLKLNALLEGTVDKDSATSLGSGSATTVNSQAVNELGGTDKLKEIFRSFKLSFLKAFRGMDRELRLHASINCFCSGTTAVTLVKQGNYLIIGNLGDSRAVLGTRDEENALTAVQLTIDLKPNLPAEAERIRKCKGRVFALHNEPEVARVWMPNNDTPGLAMARAFGDFCLKDFGLISVPDISIRKLTEKDEFVILATDGVWDVLSNREAIDIVSSAPSRSVAAKTLVESAIFAWKHKYPTSKVDDCAVVCLFLNLNITSYASNMTSSEELSLVHQADTIKEKEISTSNFHDEST
ncbi:hypothetical protein MLD38_016835 [Melastoma candidum]|uniref:Uncharacterized protein n=1 Tax=Melastoma candidum TaxID=119954 RepID=A0ACB9QNQ3_9MYRT|nr:hypothetical protein MLD38_016835 [Melastoma candidum]